MADLTALQSLRRSPLDGLEAALSRGSFPGSVRLTEWPFLTMVNLRMDPASGAAARIQTALRALLPQRCGETTQQGAHTILWLGPDEWLVLSQQDSTDLVATLRDAAASAEDQSNAQVVDVSANRTVLELGGPRARAVLEKGCPTDLHPRAFIDGTAITTTLARVPVLLWKVDANLFRVMPRASLAAYVAAWLLDAMQEFAPEASLGSARAVEGA